MTQEPQPLPQDPEESLPKPPLMFGEETKEKVTFRTLAVALPIGAAITLGFIFFLRSAGFITNPEDIYANLVSLAIASCFAMAILGSTTLIMRITGANIPNNTRYQLLEMAIKGDKNAYSVLAMESAQWGIWGLICTAIYLHFA